MLHNSLAPKVITSTLETARRLGATVPKRLSTEAAQLQELTATVHTLRGQVSNDLPTVLLDSLAAGNDPATDPKVQQAVTRRAIMQAQVDLEGVLNERAQRLVDDHGPLLLEAFRKPFDQAAATLATAAERLGDIDLSDTAAVLARGGDAASVWAQAQDAGKVIQHIQQSWKMLASVSPSFAIDPKYRILAIAEVDPGRFVDDQLANAQMRAWDIARAGHRLSLATPQTLRERSAAVVAETQRRQQQHADAFREEYKRLRGGAPAA